MEFSDHLSALLIEPQSIYLYQIAISPEYQGRNLGNKIVNFVCSLAQDFRKPLYLDCWAGNEKLKSFYLKAGLDYIGDYPEEDYLISIFKYHDSLENK